METSTLSKEKLKCTVFRRKEVPGSKMELNPVLKVIKCLKKSFMLSRIKEVFTTEEDPGQLILQLMKRN